MLHPLDLVIPLVLFPRGLQTKGKLFSYPLPCQKALESERKLGLQRTRGGIRAALLLSKQCSMATDQRDSFAFLDLVPPFRGHGDTGLWHFLVI